MTLSPGMRIGAYEVLASIGAGGMGEVYRARDMKLQRDVALKILPDTFATDPERVARFEREARTLASLNHPHIAQIHGFEHDRGAHALVMELVDGEDLAQRLTRGAILMDEALPIARQIAEALEAAHEAGIIHRDLKPANIKVRADGTVKVLDFGLAKALDAPGDSTSGSVSMSPTLTNATQVGMVLGTAAYMSPEQARGKRVDKRADIWAFGCVLYEMLTGARAFDADEVTDVLAFVITKEPNWSSLPPTTPPAIVKLLRRCLDKKPRQRLPDIGVARLEIDDALTGPVDVSTQSPTTAAVNRTGTRHWQRAAAWALAGVAFGVGVTVVAGRFRAPSPSPLAAATRLDAKVGEGLSIVVPSASTMGSTVILSPDGSRLLFVGQTKGESPQLYIRKLTDVQATALSGTAGARGPFFSPDGQWIGFFADGKLKKIAVGGGSSLTLADAPDSRGGTWADDGTIIFAAAPLLGLSRVSEAGGLVESFTQLAEGEATHRWPHALPGSKAVLFETNSSRTNHDDGTIVAQLLPRGERKVLHRGGYEPRFFSTGHFAFIREGTLFVAPLDLDRLAVAGSPVPALQGIVSSVTSGWAQVSVANTGTLVYLPGDSSTNTEFLELVDAKGKATPLGSTATNWAGPSFSPDGRFLTLMILEGAQPNLWLYDVARETLAPLTQDGGVRPTWTPDGRRITFSRSVGGSGHIFWKPADSSTDAERLTDTPGNRFAASWHPSGKLLAVMENQPGKPADVAIYPLIESAGSRPKLGEPIAFANESFSETEPAFSPDGRWLAYVSLESGRPEVYVRPFPGPGGKSLVSTDGGNYPSWSKTRSEMFFLSQSRQIMVTPYHTEGTVFRAEKPRVWTTAEVANRFFSATPYAMHPDGTRAAFARTPDTAAATQDTVRFVFNFFDELRRMTVSKPAR